MSRFWWRRKLWYQETIIKLDRDRLKLAIQRSCKAKEGWLTTVRAAWSPTEYSREFFQDGHPCSKQSRSTGLTLVNRWGKAPFGGQRTESLSPKVRFEATKRSGSFISNLPKSANFNSPLSFINRFWGFKSLGKKKTNKGYSILQLSGCLQTLYILIILAVFSST